MNKPLIEHKVLPFDGKFGKVPGHAINAAVVDGDPVDYVAIWQWNETAGMGLESLVPVGEFTKHQQRMWPNCGEVRAVILRRGRRLHAKTMSVIHQGEVAFKAAPALTKTAFQVLGLCNGQMFLEVVGIQAWAYSKRTAEDDAKILDPWARDNVAFAARMTQLQCAQATA